jgi:hypothetical protein
MCLLHPRICRLVALMFLICVQDRYKYGIEKSFHLLLLNRIKYYHLLHVACLERILNL